MLIEEVYKEYYDDEGESAHEEKTVCYHMLTISITFLYRLSFSQADGIYFNQYSFHNPDLLLKDINMVINKQLERKEGLGDFKKLYVFAHNNRKC